MTMLFAFCICISFSLQTALAFTVPKINVLCKGMDVSESLTERVESKIGKVLEKLAVDAISANVVLRVVSNDVNEIHSQTTKKNSQIAEGKLMVENLMFCLFNIQLSNHHQSSL